MWLDSERHHGRWIIRSVLVESLLVHLVQCCDVVVAKTRGVVCVPDTSGEVGSGPCFAALVMFHKIRTILGCKCHETDQTNMIQEKHYA